MFWVFNRAASWWGMPGTRHQRGGTVSVTDAQATTTGLSKCGEAAESLMDDQAFDPTSKTEPGHYCKNIFGPCSFGPSPPLVTKRGWKCCFILTNLFCQLNQELCLLAQLHLYQDCKVLSRPSEAALPFSDFEQGSQIWRC